MPLPPASLLARLVAVVLVLGGLSCSRTSSSADQPGGATVRRVVDGDTLEVDVSGRIERVRLLGIDTPESVRPGTPKECFSAEASQHMTALVPGGSRVQLQRDHEPRDSYGRLLAYVHRSADGLFVNLEMVTTGHAGVLVLAPNDARAPELRMAEAEARSAGRGLWATCGDVHRPAGRSP